MTEEPKTVIVKRTNLGMVARQAAIKKLISLHQDEFNEILAKEKAVLNLPKEPEVAKEASTDVKISIN